MNNNIIDYIKLKNYLYETGKTLNITPESMFNITADDLNKINNYFNVIPRLSPGFPVYPICNIKPAPINFHTPYINNTNDINYLSCRDINTDLYYPDHTKKSIGNDYVSHHYFIPIDTNYQSQDHTVMYFPKGGDATRINNKINNKDNKFIYIN